MDLIVVGGGLGNQMSQAALFYCKKLMNQDVRLFLNPYISNDHNGYELDSVFGFGYPFPRPLEKMRHTLLYYLLASRKPGVHMQFLRLLPSLIGWSLCLEPSDYSYVEDLYMPALSNRLFIGGWHSYQYFKDFKPELQDIYKFPSSRIPPALHQWLSSIPQTRPIVGVHIRKGDYLSPSNLEKFGSVCDELYYRSALSHARCVYPEALFILFTNDLTWCNTFLSDIDFILPPALPASLNWINMYLMQRCDSLIISNSTFSWWGAFLSRKVQLVLRPNSFISGVDSDLFFPPSWVAIL